MLAGPVATRALAGQTDAQSIVEEARRLLEAFEFDQVMSRLDTAIATMIASPDPDLDTLAQAYELHGRAHFNLDDLEQAERNFEMLLQTRADYELAADLSPRVVELFEEVKRRLVGVLLLTMPQPGLVVIDGRTYDVGRQAAISLLQGQHDFAIRQPSFGDESQRFMITANNSTILNPRMERISGTLSVVTLPDSMRVLVDDVLRGVTAPGPGGADESAPLLVDDLAPGQHRLRLERECFVSHELAFSVATPPDDRVTGVLELTPAVATVSVRTTARDAMVYVDGESRGVAPVEVPSLCEGQHVIEVRGPSGRFVDRRMWVAGATVTLDATRGLLVFAPTPDELETAAEDQRLGTMLSSSEATVMGRRDLAEVWTEVLNTSGVAWLAPVPDEPDRLRPVSPRQGQRSAGYRADRDG